MLEQGGVAGPAFAVTYEQTMTAPEAAVRALRPVSQRCSAAYAATCARLRPSVWFICLTRARPPAQCVADCQKQQHAAGDKHVWFDWTGCQDACFPANTPNAIEQPVVTTDAALAPAQAKALAELIVRQQQAQAQQTVQQQQEQAYVPQPLGWLSSLSVRQERSFSAGG